MRLYCRHLLGTGLLLLFLLAACASHPPAGESGSAVLRVRDGALISYGGLVRELLDADVVYLGENHDNPEHHVAQLRIIRGLRQEGSPFVLGVEMFQAGDQESLDRWLTGELDEGEMRRLFRERWNMPWELYGEIFLYARRERIPLVGINIPREIVTKVARSGFASLTPQERRLLPQEVTCNIDPAYRAFVRRTFSNHAPSERSFTFFCEAQMLWTKGMARHLTDYLRRNPGSRMVVVTGAGHALKKGLPDAARDMLPHRAAVAIPEVKELTRESAEDGDVDYLLLEVPQTGP